jgi:hypothetical protein
MISNWNYLSHDSPTGKIGNSPSWCPTPNPLQTPTILLVAALPATMLLLSAGQDLAVLLALRPVALSPVVLRVGLSLHARPPFPIPTRNRNRNRNRYGGGYTREKGEGTPTVPRTRNRCQDNEGGGTLRTRTQAETEEDNRGLQPGHPYRKRNGR